MAIDANVLINERIREELRNGATPQAAIHAGYERAFGTILDSNVTTLIAGLALLIFGSGPVRGFAVVLCLGIMTSMFSAVVISRALVNLIYGSCAAIGRCGDRRSLAIGEYAAPWHKSTVTRKQLAQWNFSGSATDIPFMSYALVFNVISLITFAAGGVLPRHARAAFLDRIHRRHGDRSALRQSAEIQESASALDKGGYADALGAEFRHLARRADAAAAQGRAVERRAVEQGHGTLCGRGHERAAAPRRIRRPAGRATSWPTTARSRCCVVCRRHHGLSGAALRVAVRRRRDRRQPARRGHHSRLLRAASSGSSRCRCWRPCWRCSAIR